MSKISCVRKNCLPPQHMASSGAYQAVSSAVRHKISKHKEALLEKSGEAVENMMEREREQWTADLQ